MNVIRYAYLDGKPVLLNDREAWWLVEAQAERARAIAEALQASGARSLMELLAESERHKEHLDRLCAKLEALPKIVKKKTRQ
jgi:predicted dehydrogenase